MFQKGQVYVRQELHDKYGGQRRGGISTPKSHKFIFLFTGPTGARFGYKDKWVEGRFHYTGEGQVGDMEFKGGNRAIRDHLKLGKELYLFEQLGHGNVEFVSEMTCEGYLLQPGTDLDGNPRQLIVFKLAPA